MNHRHQLFTFAYILFWILIFGTIPFIQSEQTIDPDYVPKVFSCGLVLILYAVFLIFTKPALPFSLKRHRLLLICVIAYLTLLCSSLIQSLNPGDSISDALKIIFPFMMFTVFAEVLRRQEDALTWIFRLHVAAVFIFLWYGGMQIYDALEKSTPELPFKVDYTIASTLGNKNFFSETLLMLLPFSMAGVQLLNGFWKWLCFLSSVLIVVSLVILKTASVLFAMGIGLSVLMVVYLVFNHRFRGFIRPAKNKFILAFVLIISIVALAQSSMVKASFKKIKSTVSTFNKGADEEILESDPVNRNSAYTRWFLWRNTWRLFKENPLTGKGIGNWKTEYPKYGVSGAFYLNTGVNKFEHPHNEYLLMLSERGVFTALLWLGISIMILWQAYRNFRNAAGNMRWVFLCMGCGIIFFMVISFFGYPLYRSYSPVMLSLSTAIILVFPKREAPRNRFGIPVFMIVLATGLYMEYVLSKRYEGEVNLNRAFYEQSRAHYDRMNAYVSRAMNFYFPIDLATTPLNWYKGFSFFYNQQTDSALFYFHKAELQSPYHLQVLNDLGACYENKGDHLKAMYYFEKALAVTPLYEETMLNKVVTLYNSGNTEAAYLLLHRRTYAPTALYLTCKRTVIGSVMSSVLNGVQDEKVIEAAAQKLKSDDWIAEMEKKANGSFIKLNEALKADLLQK